MLTPEEERRLNDDFTGALEDVLARGYCAFDEVARSDVRNAWTHGSAYPPQHVAKGRTRFMQTLRLATQLAGDSVLEVACGGALLSACLARPGRRVAANDLLLQEAECRRWPSGRDLELLQGDLFALDPAVVGEFELVIAAEVIEHVAHGDQFVAQLHRLVKPGGHLLLTTPNGRFFRSKLSTYSQIRDFSALEALQFQPDGDGHLFLYTREEITKVLTTAGFEVREVEITGTPAISGTAGIRHLVPKLRVGAQPLLALDRLLTKVPAVSDRLGEQMFVVAQRPRG